MKTQITNAIKELDKSCNTLKRKKINAWTIGDMEKEKKLKLELINLQKKKDIAERDEERIKTIMDKRKEMEKMLKEMCDMEKTIMEKCNECYEDISLINEMIK